MDNKRMSMETLKKALIAPVEYAVNNVNGDIYDIVPEDIAKKSTKKIVEWIVNDMATEAILNYINQNMKPQPVAELIIRNVDITEQAIKDEQEFGHDIEYIQKLFAEPVVLIGYDTSDIAMTSSMLAEVAYTTNHLAFLTITGEWVFAYEKSIICETAENLQLSTFERTKNPYFGFEYLSDVLPKKYSDVFIQ